MKHTIPTDRIFSGTYPCGIVFADRHNEVHGDYKRLAFLPYSTITLEVEKDCPPELASQIRADVARMNLQAGQEFHVSSCGQTVTLGRA